MIKVEMRLIDSRLDKLVAYGSPSAAAVDLRICSVNDKVLEEGHSYTLRPGEQVKIGTGIAVHLDSLVGVEEDGSEFYLCDEHMSYAALMLPRSGLGTKHGLVLANTVGLIDADYQGQIIVALRNDGANEFPLKALDRVTQMMIVPVVRPFYVSVQEFSNASARGEGGFGSTGKH